MAITSGFFDSVNSDRLYDADQMSTYFEGLISDGVYENVGERFVVTSANDGMKVNVGSGRALLRSHWIKNSASETLTLDPSDVAQARIDVVCLRLDTSARAITIAIKKGTATAGSPTYDPPTRTSGVWELYLASVLIGKGATQPTSITDLRPSSYCGWVTGIIEQVDTSDLFTQWQTAYAQMFARFDAYMQAKEAAFNAWFESLTKTLTVDTSITKAQVTKNLTTMDVTLGLTDIGVEGFNANTDVLFVFHKGSFWTEGVHYEIDGQRIQIEANVSIGDRVTFIVLKNIIGQDVIVAAEATADADLAATGTVTQATETHSVIHISCDTGYYFDSEVTCTLGGNQREKSNSLPAIGVIAHFFDYCDPIFISPIPDAVLCTVGNDTVPANRTLIYGGIAWYWSTVNNGIGGSYDDSEGNMLTYPGSIGSDDYSASGSISPTYIRQILEYVHASAWEEF